MSGTARALVNNMVKGVSEGFEKKTSIDWCGLSCPSSRQSFELVSGFSHPIVYEQPEGVYVQTPSQTEIVLTGADKQVVGQVAAEIRAFRSPEPYKVKVFVMQAKWQ